MNCKVCGYEVIIGGRYPDQIAQEKGYCGAGCESVDEKTKELDARFATQEGL